MTRNLGIRGRTRSSLPNKFVALFATLIECARLQTVCHRSGHCNFLHSETGSLVKRYVSSANIASTHFLPNTEIIRQNSSQTDPRALTQTPDDPTPKQNRNRVCISPSVLPPIATRALLPTNQQPLPPANCSSPSGRTDRRRRRLLRNRSRLLRNRNRV